jgi:hypothetical protein
MRDDDVRSSCLASLDVLCARFGEELPYPRGLSEGFAFRGSSVPFLSTQKGIFRAAAQQGPAALSIQTSWKSPYGDSEVEAGYLYAYRAGSRTDRGRGPNRTAIRAKRVYASTRLASALRSCRRTVSSVPSAA